MICTHCPGHQQQCLKAVPTCDCVLLYIALWVLIRRCADSHCCNETHCQYELFVHNCNDKHWRGHIYQRLLQAP